MALPAISCSRSSSTLGSKSLPSTSVLQVSLTVSEMSRSSVRPIMSRISNLRSLSSRLSWVVAKGEMLKPVSSCYWLKSETPHSETGTHTLFMFQQLQSLHSIAPWWSSSQFRNRLSLQVQRWHRVRTIGWTWAINKYIKYIQVRSGSVICHVIDQLWHRHLKQCTYAPHHSHLFI